MSMYCELSTELCGFESICSYVDKNNRVLGSSFYDFRYNLVSSNSV